MQTRQELETMIERKLVARGMKRGDGPLAFVHKGQCVTLAVDHTIYRGAFVTLFDGARKVREFRARAGDFDWHAIVAAIDEVVEARLKPRTAAHPGTDVRAGNRQLAADLWRMLGAGLSSHVSIQPSPATPGRVRVQVQDVDLDPSSVIQLYAAVSRGVAGAD